MFDVNQRMMQAMSRLPRVDVLPVPSMLFSSYTAVDARYGVTPGNILFAMHRAREAKEMAVSWRGFHVGAAVLAYTFNPACFSLYSGINIKPDEETAMNVHAEQLALQKVEDNAANHISAIVVVGEVQHDTQSGMLAETLHPCGLCRDKLASSPCVHMDETLIVSALPSFKTIELYSLSALNKFHQTGNSTEIARVNFDDDLELFKPFIPAEHDIPYTLKDTPESLAEEEIWDDSIGPILTRFRLSGVIKG